MAQDSNVSDSLAQDNNDDILTKSSTDDSSSQNDDSTTAQGDDETNVEIGVDVIYDDSDDNSSSFENSQYKVNLSKHSTNNPILLALIASFSILIFPFRRHI